MRKVTMLIIIAATVITSCKSGSGELIGVQGRPDWYGYDPLDMQYVPGGSYTMGQSDQDVPFVHQNRTKVVTISAFYMDHTEITNNEWRQFVYWVRDSISRRVLAEEFPEEFLIPTLDDEGEEADEGDWSINWEAEIDWENEEYFPILVSEMVFPENQRIYKKREIDIRKLTFDYYWLDFKRAARRESRDALTAEPGERHKFNTDRSSFIMREDVNIYPERHDLVCAGWVS